MSTLPIQDATATSYDAVWVNACGGQQLALVEGEPALGDRRQHVVVRRRAR